MASRVPAPPLKLANRVGEIKHLDQPLERYESRGRAAREQILSMLPGDWSFEGKRALDFGCGAGRTLRHFLAEAEVAEFWGCDIDDASVAWVKENLSPPIHPLRCDEAPPIPRPEGSFDLIYAISVFTHLGDSWSSWLRGVVEGVTGSRSWRITRPLRAMARWRRERQSVRSSSR